MDKKRKFRLKAGIISVIILGAILRFSNLNWDEGQHLHPDERYISLVLTAVSLPVSIQEYFSPGNPLSPFNTQYSSYIYGQLPLTAIKFLSVKLGFDSYDKAYILGRTVSAVLDTASILLVFILGRRLFGARSGLFGALAYAAMPLTIQNSHFMTMESWLTFSWLAALLISLKKIEKQILRSVVIGILLGASLAIKISSVLLLPLVFIFIFLDQIKKFSAHCFLLLVSCFFATVFSFRFFQPTIFSSASWLDWGLRPEFRRAFEFQQAAINGTVMFPPQWQWVGTTPVIFLIKNLGMWGLGPAISVLLIAGLGASIYMAIRKRDFRLVALCLFVLSIVGYNGIKFVKTMRYAVPLLGILGVFVGVGADWLIKKFKVAGRILVAGLFLTALVWAFMFISIYRNRQTRISASRWIYQNIPFGSTIAIEEWDDPLPLYLPGGLDPGSYRTFQMAVYAPDNQDKQREIEDWINRADWVVLSSYRAKGSIGKLPEQFPLMSRFYQDLESGSLGFVKAAEFISYPSLEIVPAPPGIPLRGKNWKLEIDDSSAEESFWVYDHPLVEIYKKI